MTVTGGGPVNAVASGADLERALHHGHHSSVTEHLPEYKKKKSGKTSGAKNA